MAGTNGTDILIKVRTAVGPPEVYTVVGSQRDISIDENVAEIDFSSKDQPEQVVGGGRYTSSLSFDEVYLPTDAGYVALKTSFMARTLVKIEIFEAAVAKRSAMALITKMSKNFPDQDASTVSIDMTVSGAWTDIP
jgi:predicted secreted protein